MLRNRTVPPAFALPDDTGRIRTLDDLHVGKALVLYFFRGSFSSTARRDLLAYGDVYERITWMGGELVGISVDPPAELARLRERLGVTFPLLSDSDFSVSEQYGVYASDETDVGPQPHGEPATFVLDSEGHLAFSQVQSGPKAAASPHEVLIMLIYMQKHGGQYWE